MQHVFIVGCKGIPCAYGGYETFVDKLTEYNHNFVKYHVACKNAQNKEFEYNGARCFSVYVPEIGSAAAVLYDILAIKQSLDYIRTHCIKKAIIYCLACRIGPFAKILKRKIEKLGAKFYVNPDGHEWLRSKWSAPVRFYWKFSECLMVKYADLLICDSINIQSYIQTAYAKYKPKTKFIAYGAEIKQSKISNNDKKIVNFFEEKKLKAKEYYLIVGRFVPENNFETMIREFMQSKTKKSLAIITGENDKFYKELLVKLNFDKDERIKFIGTVYDKEFLMKIREQAYAYIHGHEVGGTNPSLLESLASTNLNLLLDVSFNKEVGANTAFYWTKKSGSLANLIECTDKMTSSEILNYAKLSTERIINAYSWDFISNEYNKLWSL